MQYKIMQYKVMQYKNVLQAVIAISGLLCLTGLTACQSGGSLVEKIDNGSLDYLQAKQLEPLQLPAEKASVTFTPLYPTPKITQNTLEVKNEQGTRYKLPPPRRAIQP